MLIQLSLPLELKTSNARHEIVASAPQCERAFNFLKMSPVVVVDTETSGLRWFDKSELVGLCLGGVDQDSSGIFLRAFYFPVRHDTGENQLSLLHIYKDVGEILSSDKLKIAHNIKFDEHILRREGWVLDGPRFDTMIAARLYDENRSAALKERAQTDLGILDAGHHEQLLKEAIKRLAKRNKLGITEYRDRFGYQQVGIGLCGTYSCLDVEYTYELYKLYLRTGISTMFDRIWKTEMDLTGILTSAEEAGMLIDVEYLEKLRKELVGYQKGIEDHIAKQLGRPPELSRDEVVRGILISCGCQLTKRTATNQLSVDREVLESFADQHPIVPLILDWREAEKLRSTYTESILQRLDSKNFLHPDFQQVGTDTGRLSCRNPNFQNQPADSNSRSIKHSGKSLEDGGIDPWSIRRAYCTRGPGWLRLFFDYSQIELRVLSFYTRDPIMVEAYQRGEDIHSRTSLEVFGTKEKAFRRISKVINFGLSYGMSAVGLSRQAKIDLPEAEDFLKRFFDRYQGVARFRPIFCQQVRERNCFFQNLFGRPRRLPMLRRDDRKERGEAERQAIATLIQGTAAELTKESLVRISNFFRAKKLPAYIVATVHDEIQIDCRVEALTAVAGEVKRMMENFPEFAPIPIVVDGEFSITNWAEKKKLPS